MIRPEYGTAHGQQLPHSYLPDKESTMKTMTTMVLVAVVAALAGCAEPKVSREAPPQETFDLNTDSWQQYVQERREARKAVEARRDASRKNAVAAR